VRQEGQINKYVSTLLAGEVPRLLLKEYEASRLANRKLEDQLEQLRAENSFLRERTLTLEVELA